MTADTPDIEEIDTSLPPNLDSYLARYKSLEEKLEGLGEEDPAELLITFPIGGEDIPSGTITIKYKELTAFCPWTAFPDQGTVEIDYEPKDLLLELKSLKYYFLAFRERHITQEHLARKMFADLKALLEPGYLKVHLDYMPRGGLHTVYEMEQWLGKDRIVKSIEDFELSGEPTE